MHPLARRISFLVSAFTLIIGLFLLGYNLHVISDAAKNIALNLWPLLLVLAGIMLFVDSSKKRRFTRATTATTRHFPIRIEGSAKEVSCRVQFSYGRLVIADSPGDTRLVTEQMGPVIAPSISNETVGSVSEISIATSQPLFPAHFQLRNTWRLEVSRGLPLSLALQLHAVSLSMDLRKLDVEALDLSADSGSQEILIGAPRKKLAAQLSCASGDLSIVLPPGVFAWVRLLNPFCRVDYPQGDMEKREDGSLVTAAAPNAAGSIEITIDGPIRNLVLDIEGGLDS
ncbi:MAG TPA: hypothetical protein VMV03_03120 [Spirochaetia bacterium]|nr:hypothetical protein [Spirochaetia bacterium]